MKEVLAVIRMNMVNKTKKSLSDAGISSFSAKECLGRGKGIVDYHPLLAAEKEYEEAIALLGQSQRLIPKRMLTIVVPDKLVKKTVAAIIGTNRTGKSGDGKIFILPVSESYRVRTGECGDTTLDDV
jgi:nitrogen regulatory protein PII 2